jgi:hypothetical protein
MSAMSCALLKPRPAGIGSTTRAPLPKNTSDSRSCLSSNASTNVLAASLTAGHRAPIELETSSTSDRSTMRRVASPALVTVTSVKFPSRMNVVGSFAVAVTVTTFAPVAGMVWSEKNPGSVVGSVTDDVPMKPTGKLALKIRSASPRGSPLFRLRAAASAAPSTAFDSCAFTT